MSKGLFIDILRPGFEAEFRKVAYDYAANGAWRSSTLCGQTVVDSCRVRSVAQRRSLTV